MRLQLVSLAAMIPAVMAGINCKGSMLCPMASFLRSSKDNFPAHEGPLMINSGKLNIAQGLRDAMYSSSMPDEVTYNSGDHVICVSSSMPLTIKGGVGVTNGVAGGELNREDLNAV